MAYNINLICCNTLYIFLYKMFPSLTRHALKRLVGVRYMSPYSDMIIQDTHSNKYNNKTVPHSCFIIKDTHSNRYNNKTTVPHSCFIIKDKPTLNLYINSHREKDRTTKNIISSVKSLSISNLNTFSDDNYIKCPSELRKSKLSKISKSDIFVYIYDETNISNNNYIEFGYWLAKQDYNVLHGKKCGHTVIIMLNKVSIKLVKMLPNTTYIHFDKDKQINSFNNTNKNYPNLITIYNSSDLSSILKNIIIKNY